MADYTTRISLANQRALITGASRGIGAEIAAVFADAGADLVIAGRDAAGLEATRQVVEQKGRRCLSVTADLRTVEGPRAVGRKALEFLGAVDILVNNALCRNVRRLIDDGDRGRTGPAPRGEPARAGGRTGAGAAGGQSQPLRTSAPGGREAVVGGIRLPLPRQSLTVGSIVVLPRAS